MSNIFKKCGKGKHSRLGYRSYNQCVKGKGRDKYVAEFGSYQIIDIDQISSDEVMVHIKAKNDKAEYRGIIEEI